ncbi:DUF1566 domain-containing protein [Thermodesulfobacteriota bacterium]
MNEQQKSILVLIVTTAFVVAFLLLPNIVGAGDLDPPPEAVDGGNPVPTMHTLEEIYNKVDRLEGFLDAISKTPEEVCQGITFSGMRDDGLIAEMMGTKTCRFSDLGNGTVRDNNSGLIWLKDAEAFGQKNWADAKAAAATLNSGEQGLTDGSSEGDWRLPTKAEWEAFVDTSYTNPALCNAAGTAKWAQGNAFIDVQSVYYWSSTEFDSGNAWVVYMYDGNVDYNVKGYNYYVWPVRSDN